MVHHSTNHFYDYRSSLVPSFLVLSHTLALIICSQDKTKRCVNLLGHYDIMPTPRLGFSPHEAHAHQAFFGWIMPTIRTSEFTVLQIVGLDAAVVSSIVTVIFVT